MYNSHPLETESIMPCREPRAFTFSTSLSLTLVLDVCVFKCHPQNNLTTRLRPCRKRGTTQTVAEKI